MYGEGFSRVYNELGWNVWPELFAEQLLAWLRETGRTVRTALDLGCGTGVLCEALSAAGIRTLGVDLSPEMIGIARSRSPELAYEAGDMTVWRAPGTYDLVTCTGDALNHLASPDEPTPLRSSAPLHSATSPSQSALKPSRSATSSTRSP